MKQEGRREQISAELAALQGDMEKNLSVQEQFIKRFQHLMQTEEEMICVINSVPCPLALFKKGGVLYQVNRTLMENTDLRESDLSERDISFLDRITSENFAILEAVEGVFYGKTALLSRLSTPLSLFCKSWSYPCRDDYRNALIFPLSEDGSYISLGAIMLMRR